MSSPYTPPPYDARVPAAPPPPQGGGVEWLRVYQRPIGTIGLIAAIGFVFALQLLLGRGDSSSAVARMGGLQAADVRHGAWWELLSPAFLHFGIVHIAMNCYVLFAVGRLIEPSIGWRRFLLAFLVSALAGNAAAAIPVNAALTAGASGGIWGLMTLAAALVVRRPDVFPGGMAERLRPSLIRALLINAAVSFIPGVSFLAHLGGAVGGAVLGFSGALHFDVAPFPARPSKPLWLGLATSVGSAAAAACVVVAVLHGRAWIRLLPPQLHRVEIPDSGLSLELPTDLRQTPTESAKPAGEVAYGTVRDDGIFVDARVVNDDSPAADRDANLQQMANEAAKNLPEGFTLDGTNIERTGPRPVLTIRAHASDGRVSRQLVTYVGERVVILIVVEADPPAAWYGFERRVIDSIQTSARPAAPTNP